MSDLREQVCLANKQLLTAGLVTMHSGNVSAVCRSTETIYIKPSGVDYETMTPADVVAVSLADGKPLDLGLRPSVDLPHHLFLYRSCPEIQSVVHTHSNYATAFAAVGRSIPPILTAIADEFGGAIPCSAYVDNEGDHIGQEILRVRNDRAPAVLLAHHGVFAWGPDVRSAMKAAIMVEDVAKTAWLALQLGQVSELPLAEVEKWWDRYQNRYGQGCD